VRDGLVTKCNLYEGFFNGYRVSVLIYPPHSPSGEMRIDFKKKKGTDTSLCLLVVSEVYTETSLNGPW